MSKRRDDGIRFDHMSVDRRGAIKLGVSGAIVAAIGGRLLGTSAQAEERVSSFGVYTGYSDTAYDGWKRTSLYVSVRDGTRLAMDVYRPTVNGVLHKDPLPVVWVAKRYQRAVTKNDGTFQSAIDGPTASVLIKHGYIVVAVDRRGTGSSFGSITELSNPMDALDGYDITEWLAKQPWSSGNIGMFGVSYEGEIQLRIASTAPPHLKVITPEVSPFDWYWICHPGGTYRPGFVDYAAGIQRQDVDPNNGRVDADSDGKLLAAAITEHKAKNDYSAPNGKMPDRDSPNPVTGKPEWLLRHGGVYTDGIAKSGIAVYHRTGWFAAMRLDQLAWYVNQKSGPKKMLIGPWHIGGLIGDEYQVWLAEQLRFYDYWLKGVKNGIMDEPPIHSSVPSAHIRQGTSWRGISKWPLPNEKRTDFFLAAGPTKTIASLNDGLLTTNKPTGEQGQDHYTAKPEPGDEKIVPVISSINAVMPGQKPVDRSGTEKRWLTYTTEPLESEMEMTGCPTARFWISSTAPDGDIFIKIHDVDETGVSTYVTDGTHRMSHRALGKAPYDFFGMPWTSSLKKDVANMPLNEPVELILWLYPMSYIFRKSHRIRLTIMGLDPTSGPSPTFAAAPVVTVHRNSKLTSLVTLPIIPSSKT
jgi:putative CocE/NonD family hydrolase